MQSLEENNEAFRHTLSEDGSITFFYRPSARLENKKILLDSPDLYDLTLDGNGNRREFEPDPANQEYFLRIDNVPSNLFATYRIKVIDIVPPGSLETPHEKIVPPGADQPIVLMNHLNLYAGTHRDLETKPSSIIQEKTAYIRTGIAQIPPYFKPAASAEIQPHILRGTVEHGLFESSNPISESPDQIKRDTWVYKPQGFDSLPPEERKVIFMLDGKDFCEKLTPSFDEASTQFSKTAIVFIDPGQYQPPPPPEHIPPDRVQEDYIQKERFSIMLGDELIPKYCHDLEISNTDNVILSAHSLAAYPMLGVAEKYPDQIGGLFLFSPALNQKEKPNLPPKELPIFMQIGAIEDTIPPQSHQNDQHMQDKTRLKATEEFHDELVSHGNNVQPSLRIHPYGHDSVHVFEGMVEGMNFQQSRLGARTTMNMKHLLNEQRAASKPLEAVDDTLQQAQAITPTPRPGSL